MSRWALVTGSAGFIGRHMTVGLRNTGYKVLACDLKTGVDCRTAFSDRALSPDLVVHCAALVDGRETIDGSPALLGAYNLELDSALWQFALRNRPGRVVYLSSSAAYPVAAQNWPAPAQKLRETMRCDPDRADATYGMTKCVGERMAAEVRAAGVPVTVVRPFSGYGADQDKRYPFPAMIARAARRESPFDVWGDGHQVRDFVHVSDIVRAVLALVDARADGPVNVGTGIGTTMDELARECMRAAGYDAPIRHLDAKPSGVAYRVASTRLLECFYRPRVTLRDGVEEALMPGSPANPIRTVLRRGL